MFSCKVCKEKDARIADLKDQLAKLWKQVSPSASQVITNLEASSIFNGSGAEAIEITPERVKAAEEVADEYHKIISGNY